MGLYSIGIGSPYQPSTSSSWWCKVAARQLTPGLVISVFNNLTGVKESGLIIGVADYSRGQYPHDLNIVLDVLVEDKMYDMACTPHHAADVWVLFEASDGRVV
jgi:hypothetical protein